MASSNQDLLQLFTELKAAGSPVRRMQILGRAWRTLRRLSPKARRDLAAQVGVDGAEDVLEQLAGKGRRLSPAALLAALEALRGADPNDLRQTLSDLQPSEGRPPSSEPPLTELDAVTQRAEQTPQPAATTPATAAAAAAVAAGVAAVAARPPRTTPARRQAVARERQRAARPTTRAVSSPAATAATATRSTPRSDARPDASPTLRTKAPSARPARSATPRPAPRSVAFPAARREPTVGNDLVAALADTGRLSSKFRILRERVDDSRGMPVEELRRVLDAFPSEWARRRALSWLLDRRIPRDLDQAIHLVEGLESPASQRWCVARILHAWPLTEQERSALLERRGALIRRVS